MRQAAENRRFFAMSSGPLRMAAFGTIAAVMVLTSEVFAEDVRGQGVAERQYDAYTAPGVRVGSFVLRPSLTVSETYDSNVFASDTDEVSDFVTEINPNVVFESDWANHSLRFEADLEQSLHASEDSEDSTDWSVGVSGRVDVLNDTQLRAGVLYGSLTEDRGEPEDIGAAAEPTDYSLFEVSTGVTQRFNRLSFDVGAEYSELDFDDTPLIGGGFDENDDRDRSVLEIAVEVGYELVADTIVFLRGTYNERDYELDIPAVAVNRDSDGYEVVAGASFELGSLATGEVFAGYQEQSFDNPSFSSVSGIAYGASVDWYVTPLTTLRFSADTAIEDTTSGGASAFESQTVGVGVDHEFLRNLVASLDVEYTEEDFASSARKDEIYEVEVGIDYLIDQVFSVGVFAGYEERDSSIAGDSFSREVVGVRLRSAL
ncbi:outer membrane beta-barrel protein [Parvibaculaceae bacterium PLY_AMNH_Bact1]|nr:outer membrane beta-barrel protein [Parvibaculaceae bacterium PLY_AMNH_Bact1]